MTLRPETEDDDSLRGYAPILEAYFKYLENMTPEQEAEAQRRFSEHVAYLNSPEGQAESARMREYYGGYCRHREGRPWPWDESPPQGASGG